MEEHTIIPIEVSVPLHCLAVLLPLLGNVSMLVIVCRVPMLHTPSFVLLSCLATVDILLALVWNLPSHLVDQIQARDMETSFLSPGSAACTVIGIAWQTAVSMSTLLQATIACDRYLFIVHPFKYQRCITSCRAAGCCAAIFALSICIPAFIFISGEAYRLEDPTGICIQSKTWPLLFLTIVFLPSVSLVVFSSQRVRTLYARMLQQLELMQDCTPVPISDRRARSGEKLPANLQESRGTSLRKVIQSVIMHQRAFKSMRSRPRTSSKPDRNTAAPRVLITSCEKGDGVPNLAPTVCVSGSRTQLYDSCSGHSLTPVETPIFAPLNFATGSIDRVMSPCSSCSSPGPISCSTSTAEKSPRYLTPHPYQSRRPSAISADSSKSLRSSFDSEHSGLHQFSLSSATAGRSFSSPDIGFLPSSPSPSSGSTISVRQSLQFSLAEPEDILTGGSSTVSAILSALMVTPTCTQSGFGSSFSNNNHTRKKRKLKMAALHWASVGNPVISWMMTLQSDRADYLSCENDRPNKEGHSSSASCPIYAQKPAIDFVRKIGPSFLFRAKTTIAAKCSAAKALLLLWGPLFLILVSFLPFSVALVVWEFGLRTPFISQYVNIVCFLTYTTVPSLASLVLCLSNKPYRKVLLRNICCFKKTRDRPSV
ncbi:onychopsin [Elysia marginata]|uniref:Onychopsin n=1 Tax=Elysia marginata TaxID=1093978 RepID=A0AAV4IKK0_9GAST|nr:onychopsin [Elysia marginata]